MTKPCPALDPALLRALLTYLDPQHGTRHPALLREELQALLCSCAPSPRITMTLLDSANRHIGLAPLLAYLDTHGHGELFKIADLDGDPVCALRQAKPQAWPQRYRRDLYKILEPYALRAHHLIPNEQLKTAVAKKDLDWFEFITGFYAFTDKSIDEHIHRSGFLRPNSQAARDLVCRIAGRIDPEDPAWAAAFERSLAKEDLLSSVIYMSAGFDPVPILRNLNFGVSRKGSWMARLHQSLEVSSHARIVFAKALPPIAQIARMSLDDLEMHIAGPNARQAKALARREKRDRARAHFLTHGLPLPASLQNPDDP